MIFGRLGLSSTGEWIVYDTPLAKAISKLLVQVTIDGVGKINASKLGTNWRI
jgi:hypothetical protein